jgi:hypothetical protein
MKADESADCGGCCEIGFRAGLCFTFLFGPRNHKFILNNSDLSTFDFSWVQI